VARDLFAAWGGAAAEPAWPSTCSFQLTHLGLFAKDAEIVATCAAAAVQALSRGPAEAAANLGQAAVAADNVAHTLWKLARIDLAQGRFDDARSRIDEAYAIMLRLDRAEGIAVVGMSLGPMLAASEQRDEALVVLRRSVDMFRKLGLEKRAQEADWLIAELGLG
jgi:tetratricopeptide (TPR) repeat protein